MNKIYQKSFLGGKNAGFTLIELLVVVLVIGVLAAVALPQYEKAVKKSRYVQLITLTESIFRAQQVYQMANGSYSFDFNALDVSLPADMEPMFTTSDGRVYAMKNSKIQCVFSTISGLNHSGATYVSCYRNNSPRLVYYITLATGQRYCGAITGNSEDENWCKYLTNKQTQFSRWGGYSLYLFDNVP